MLTDGYGMREKGTKDDSKIFCLSAKMDLLLNEMKKTVSEADLGREVRVQFWTCYF